MTIRPSPLAAFRPRRRKEITPPPFAPPEASPAARPFLRQKAIHQGSILFHSGSMTYELHAAVCLSSSDSHFFLKRLTFFLKRKKHAPQAVIFPASGTHSIPPLGGFVFRLRPIRKNATGRNCPCLSAPACPCPSLRLTPPRVSSGKRPGPRPTPSAVRHPRSSRRRPPNKGRSPSPFHRPPTRTCKV